MKYLHPTRKGLKIRVAPRNEIEVMMFNVVRVEENFDKYGNIADGNVTVMSMTGEEMLYQPKGKMLTKKRYIVEMLKDKRFRITDDFKFITLDKCLK